MGYKYYYTFEEACKPNIYQPYNDILHANTQPTFKNFVQAFYSSVPTWADSASTEFNYINECFERIRHMFKRNNYFFWVSDNEYDDTNVTGLNKLHDEVANRVVDFIETMYETKDKYIALISNQATLKANLLNDIAETNETWFNDTPQSTGTYTTENYTTTYNKNVRTVTLGAVSDKLAEIDRAMNDYYNEWVDEFKKFIILD